MKHLVLLALLASPAAAQNAFEGSELFRFHCASCHGIEAMGDGPLGEVLTIPPANLTALAVDNDGVFPLARVLERIDGTVNVKAHGDAMPVFGLLLDGPTGVMAAPDGSDVTGPEAILSIANWLMSVQVE